MLRAAYRAKLPVGLDTEFATDDIRRSNAFRASTHLITLGIPTLGALAKGVPVAHRVVLGRGAFSALGGWFASDHKKLLYNAPSDLHTLANDGIHLANWRDLLPFSRYVAPDHKDHSLKYHIQHTLGYVGQGEYRDNFYRPVLGVNGQPTKAREPIPLREIVPDHPLWEKLVEYAALDSKATVELGLLWSLRYGIVW